MSDDPEADAKTKDAQPAPWTVKGMPREQRDAINAAARRADVTVAAFIWDACEAKIRADRQAMGSPAAPSGTALVRHPGAALVPAGEASHGQAAPVDDLAKLTELALRLSAADVKDMRAEALQAARKAVTARLARIAE